MREKNEALIEIKSYCTNIYILHSTQIFLWRHLPICFRWYMVCWDIKSVITVWKFSKRLNVLVFNQKMRLKNCYNLKQTRQQQKPAYCGSIVCGLTYCALLDITLWRKKYQINLLFMSKECMSQYKGVPYLFMFFLSQRTQFQIILITFCWQLKFKRKIRFILLKFRFLSVVE